MSDETNLETTIPAEPPAVETVGSPPKAEPPIEEQAHVDQRGQQVVPLAKLLQIKDEAKATKAELETLRQEADQYKQFAQQFGPYAQLLQQRPELVQMLTGQGQPPKAEAPQPQYDPEAEAIAREFDLYTPQGQPDLARAQRFLERIDKRFDGRVSQAIRPVQETALQTRATALRSEAANYLTRTGYAKPQTFDKVASMLPPELQANEEVMRLVMVIARGLDGSPPPTGERVERGGYEAPLTTEAAGRRGGPPALSEMEQRIAAQRGVSPEQWRKLSDTSRTELE